MEFRPISGNAGTGMYRRGAYEHGREFAPVAEKTTHVSKFLVPLFKHHAVASFDEHSSASDVTSQDGFIN